MHREAAAQSMSGTPPPMVGIGYRAALDAWTQANLDKFDVLEVTISELMYGTAARREAIFGLVGQIPLTAHSIGLSIGTDVPLDLEYLDKAAVVVKQLKAPALSEHLAFTGIPGRELGNLLPVPRTEAVAESIIAKVRTVQARVGVPFLLENIAYIFEWPDAALSDGEFASLICRETGAGWLLDIENLHLNAVNHRADPYEFIDSLPAGAVKEIHMAGGVTLHQDHVKPPYRLERPFSADTHSHPVPEAALDLLEHALRRHGAATIILERDERLDAVDEILDDVRRIRERVAALTSEGVFQL
jgi:uncharacterized protein (UPF0276 family)